MAQKKKALAWVKTPRASVGNRGEMDRLDRSKPRKPKARVVAIRRDGTRLWAKPAKA